MRIALVGNQNSGKTSLFNILTGANQKVGNWPGVTIERKTGTIKGTNYQLIDLPGIYSLSPYTAEEEVSRKYIYEENPDLIINIIDATSIERSLYLTTQLLELDTKVIIALNMSDVLNKKGVKIDVSKLSKELGVEIVEISALKKTGIDNLVKLISKDITNNKEIKIYDDIIEEEITKIAKSIDTKHKRFTAIKLLEADKMFSSLQTKEVSNSIQRLNNQYNLDMEELFANARYDYIVDIKRKTVISTENQVSLTDKLDKIFLNKYAAIPIFVMIMFFIYYFSVGVIGTWTVDFIDINVGKFSEWLAPTLQGLDASPWAVSLIVDGIISGVGAVLTFLPQLIILFILIALLETTGYMSRISFLLDKIFKKFGLSGKSLIPFILGSGCSVPGIMSTRTIEGENERKMSIMLTPFIPCSAKLPIIALFAGYFFDKHAGLVSASLYFLSIIILLLSAIFLKKVFYRGSLSTYIAELPEYKTPSFRYITRDVFEKASSFVKRAGTIILLSSIVIWFLLSFSWRLQYGVDIDKSILASLGKTISWIFYPMLGEFSWEAAVSAIQGLIAKEQVVSSMNIIAGVAADSIDSNLLFASSSVFGFFNGASAYAFMVFNLFSAPCFGAIGAMRKEFGSTKLMLGAVLFQTGLAWILAVLVFLIGTGIGVMF